MTATSVCSKCASVWPQGTPFCSTCGTSLLVGGVLPAYPPPPTAPRTSGMSITGFVLSFFCGVLGLIFSLIGYFDVKKSKGQLTGEGFALAGIIISLLSIVGTLMVWFLFLRAVDEIDQAIKDTDVRIELRSVVRAARETYDQTSRFPTRDAAPTTSCCSEPDNRCRNGDDPALKAIDYRSFGSSRYRLGYRSTPQSFTAIAIIDSDCDGDEVTFTMTADAVEGHVITGAVERSGTD